MSSAPADKRARDLDAEQEIDLGRLWRSVIARWWLLLVGFVVGAIIGLLVSLGGGKQWKATTELYLGSPLAPNAGAQITSAPTTLALATTYANSEAALRYTSAHSGIPTAQLRGKISVKPILGLTGTKIGQPAPLMLLSVTGAKAGRTQHAADVLANQVVKVFLPYAAQKLVVLKAQVATDESQLANIETRLKQAENAESALAGSAASGQVFSNYQTVIASLTDQRLGLQGDRNTALQQIAAAQDIEQARVVSPALSLNQGGPSRRSGVVIGAIIGLVLGLLAAVFWEPIVRLRRPQQTD
ncbi:MAG TPA: Wzz/FepE/Etk N-terminal domain-containing protein [Gaiellaceae bacterium]|nr:Wzz/FepE/Etk N-terminal domain-containing protein [Gaiellaceae bacterium]